MTEPTPPAETAGSRIPVQVRTDEVFRRRAAALGDKTRLAIYRAIAAHETPIGVAALVDRFDLNHNTVRQHLVRLVDAALVETVREPPRGPGRPPVGYRLTGDAAAGWNDEGPYERLSLLLLEIATTGRSPLEVGRRAGRRMVVDADRSTDPVGTFMSAVTAQGFAPRIDADTGLRDGADMELVLDNCPFARAAEASPEVVCALHRGMVEGLAERLGGLSVTGLVPEEPDDAGCRVRIRTPADHA